MIFSYFQHIACEPLLVVVLMVKNEASVIEATLQPYVDGGITDFVIFDTGSTDGTQEVTAAFFERHALTNAHIIEEPFINFATSRNRALELTENLFPQATFMLMPDAEWYMHNVEGLLQFCAEHQHDTPASYLVPTHLVQNALTGDTLEYGTGRLIRCHRGIRFVGRVHEELNQISHMQIPQDIYFRWQASQKGIAKSAQRWVRDRDWLLEDYEQNPYNPRTLFYLGQTYTCLGDFENAYIYYQKRAEINGWDEENFVTQMRLGDIAKKLAAHSASTETDLAIKHYLAAFTLRPHRAEPLIKIAQCYLEKGDMHLAFEFAVRAVNIPYPLHDSLFVEKYLYTFTRYDILGICAWYVGEYELGEWAVLKALKANPQEIHLWRNLQLYYSRTKNNGSQESISSES